jgi:hypothetical protein
MLGWEEVVEMDEGKAIITDCSTACTALAKRRRGTGKVLACRAHWTPQPRYMTFW